MEMLNWIQEFSPAQVMVAFLLLPWLAVALMHIFAAALHQRFDLRAADETWQTRAGAAVKWLDANKDAAQDPVAHRARSRKVPKAVLEFRAKRAPNTPRTQVANRGPVELDAA